MYNKEERDLPSGSEESRESARASRPSQDKRQSNDSTVMSCNLPQTYTMLVTTSSHYEYE